MPIFYSEPRNTNTDNTLTSNAIALGSPTGIDALYVVGTGFTSMTYTGFGASDNKVNRGAGQEVRSHGGKVYLFYTFKEKTSGAKTATFVGSSIVIEKIHLLSSQFSFDDDDTFVRMDMSNNERGAVIHEDLYGNITKVQGYFKREVSYTATNQSYADTLAFEHFRENNNYFHFLEDYDQWAKMPDRLYPAVFDPEFRMRYAIQNKNEGFDIDFTIIER